MATRARLAFPWPGLAFASGLLAAECAYLVRPLFDGFGAGGAWAPLAEALLRYALMAMAVDLLAQLVPRPWARRASWRSAAAALAWGALALVSGQVPGGVALLMATAWILAVIASTRLFVLPLLVAAWALVPALPRRSAPPAGGVGVAPGIAAPTRPSLAVIVLDTVRRDRCSTYGHARPTTPNLDALAARGVRFDRAYSTSCWTLPAHASLFTGLLPRRHGADYEHLSLGPAAPTLAALLSARGYATAGFSANPLVAPGNGLARGFAHFEEPWRDYTLRESLTAFRVVARFAAPDRDKAGRQVVRGALHWLERRPRERPFFLFVNLMEAHAPYQEVPVRWRRAFTRPQLRLADLEALGERSHLAQVLKAEVPPGAVSDTLDLADGAIAAADAYLGELLPALDERTVVVVLSDHGELFGEHGLWGHNLGLWEPLVHVPLVMAGPDLPRGARRDDPVSLLDLFPTLLGVAGLEPPPSDGVDLAPVLQGRVSLEGRALRAEHFRPDFFTRGWQVFHPLADHRPWRARRAAVIVGTRKRIVSEDGSDLAFDLAQDPQELDPGAGPAAGLEVTLPEPRAGYGAVPTPDAAQRERLKALGYSQ